MIDAIAHDAVKNIPSDRREQEFIIIQRSLTKARDAMVCEGVPEEYCEKILRIMGKQFTPWVGQPSPYDLISMGGLSPKKRKK
jgi:hypothetical protein